MIGSKLRRAALAVTLFIPLAASCGADDGTNAVIKTVIDENPVTLDPQTSVSDSSIGIIANVFTGLFAYDEGGTVVPAMAESCDVSDDGLVWDFKLKENVMWYDGGEFSALCTADDYVFAFRRLINPATKSKRASEYFCIKNAERLNKSVISDMTMLGVEALGEHELRITLEEPCPDLKSKLADAPAMPCNEDYFYGTEGRYGLSEDCLASNGSFYLYSWRYDKWSDEGNYIVLRKNKLNNTEGNNISPYSLTFFIGSDGCAALKNKEIHCYAAEDPDDISELSSFSHREYEAGNFGIIFNCGGVFSELSLRAALAESLKRRLSSAGYDLSDVLIPDTAMLGEVCYRQSAGEITKSDVSLSALFESYTDAVRVVGAENMSGLKLIMPKNIGMRDCISSVLQGWQKDHGFFCSFLEYDDPEYESALRSGDFDIAVVRLRGNNAAEYFDSFTFGSSKNYYGIRNRKLEHILKNMNAAADADKAVAYCNEAEQTVLDMYYFVPISFGTDVVFYADGVSGVKYDSHNGVFLFKDALRVK